jgi:hypothetical protein
MRRQATFFGIPAAIAKRPLSTMRSGGRIGCQPRPFGVRSLGHDEGAVTPSAHRDPQLTGILNLGEITQMRPGR